jgi:hypothetical protein
MRVMLTLDSKSLPVDEAAALQHLVKDADFFNLVESPSVQSRADGFQYSLTIQAGEQQRTLHVRDGAIPEKLQALLSDLMLRARSQRRAD